MPIPTIYPDEMNLTEEKLYRWSFCYLHGEAEFEYDPENGAAPDLFLVNQPMPTEAGSYPVTVRGLPAVAVIATRYSQEHLLSGRVALVTDTEALTHALNVDAWK